MKFALLKEEAESMVGSSVEARRASGTARILARDLLARLGFPRCALPKGPTGSPLWPVGITGLSPIMTGSPLRRWEARAASAASESILSPQSRWRRI